MRFPRTQPLAGAAAALLFLLAACASYLALGWLARPSDFAKRLSAAKAAQQATSLQQGALPRRFPDTAVCNQATVPASQTLHRTLSDAAARRGLTVSQLQVAPGAPERALPGLAGIDVQLVTTGSQSNALSLIADLERASPVVFVDQLELRPKDGAVVMTLAGRAFCAIPAR